MAAAVFAASSVFLTIIGIGFNFGKKFHSTLVRFSQADRLFSPLTTKTP